MTDFVCVKCGSDNIQIVRGVFESGTEAKYKQREDFTKIPTIDEVLALDQEKIVITFQSRIAEKLGNIKLKKYMEPKLYQFSYKLEDFLEAPETYQNIKNKLNIKKNKLIESKKEFPRSKKNSLLNWEMISLFLLFFLSLLIAVYDSSEDVSTSIFFLLISISLLIILLYRVWQIVADNKKRENL